MNLGKEDKNAIYIYQNEIEKLKKELSQVNKNLIDRSILITVQEEKNKAVYYKEKALE